MTIDDYMTIREAFIYLKCDEWHLRGLIKRGLIESAKIHRNHWPDYKRSGKPLEMMVVRKADIDAYLEKQKVPSTVKVERTPGEF